MDFRLKIFHDTLWMIKATPWTGTGLGAFEAIFPLYRSASVLQQRVLHPESDWLWLVAEAGLPGMVATAGFAIWMGARAGRQLARRRDRSMQIALCVACLGVLAHSFVDVPAHRLGTLMPALLLMGLAAGDEEKRGGIRVLRVAGLVVLAMGVGSLAVIALGIPLPVVNGVEMLNARAAREEAAGKIWQGRKRSAGR